MNVKLHLSAGPPVAGRVFGAFIGVLFAAMGAGFTGLTLLADRFLRELGGGSSCGGVHGLSPASLPPTLQRCELLPGLGMGGLGPVRYVGLVGVPFALVGVYLALRFVRTAAWLDGTTLWVRYAVGRRAVDLATAELSVRTVIQRTADEGRLIVDRVPTLFAEDPRSGRRVSVALRLPATQLRSLAGATTANRHGGEIGAELAQLAVR